MSIQKCQMDQVRSYMKLSLTFILDAVVWGGQTESIHLDKADGIDYLQ